MTSGELLPRPTVRDVGRLPRAEAASRRDQNLLRTHPSRRFKRLTLEQGVLYPNRFSECELVNSFEPLTRVIRHNQILRATTMSAEEEYYRKGDRVRLSELGRKRMSRNRASTATVVGFGRSETTIRIVFDGSSYPVSIHSSYLERDSSPRDARRDHGGPDSHM
jgi:hypothetical protein